MPTIPVPGGAYSAICLDAFGTLVQITRHTRPYHALIQRLPEARRAEARTLVMSQPLDLREAAERLGISHTKSEMAKWKTELALEADSIECFPETLEVLEGLCEAGYALALCSNLAEPYAAPVARLVGQYFDLMVWSFEAGCIKPDPRIYAQIAQGLAIVPERVLMTGDTEDADFLAPREAGMGALHLVRRAPAVGYAPHQIADLRALLMLR